MTTEQIEIETSKQGFTIKSSTRLRNLRCLIEKEPLEWQEQAGRGCYYYYLTFIQLKHLFKADLQQGAAMVYGENNHAFSFKDFDIVFKNVATLRYDDEFICLYPSVYGELRLGVNWQASAKKLIKASMVERVTYQAGQLVYEAELISRYIPITQLQVTTRFNRARENYQVPYQLSPAIRLDDNCYQQKVTFTVGSEILKDFRRVIAKNPYANNVLTLRFEVVTNIFPTNSVSYRLAGNQTMIDAADPIVEPTSHDNLYYTYWANAYTGDSFGLRGVLLTADALAEVSQPKPNVQSDILIVDGRSKIAQEGYLAYQQLRARQIPNVYYVTEKPDPKDAHALQINSVAHIQHFKAAKTIIYALRVAYSVPVRSEALNGLLREKQILFLPHDLQAVMRWGKFHNLPKKDEQVIVGSSLESKYAKNVVGLKARQVKLLGKPTMDQIRLDNPQQVAEQVRDKQVLWSVGPDILAHVAEQPDVLEAMQATDLKHILSISKHPMAKTLPFQALVGQQSLNDFSLIITDNQNVAYQASVCHIPTILLDESILNPDSLYWVCGPSFKTFMIAKVVLLKALRQQYDFKTYVEQSYQNVDAFNDTNSIQRLLDLIK